MARPCGPQSVPAARAFRRRASDRFVWQPHHQSGRYARLAVGVQWTAHKGTRTTYRRPRWRRGSVVMPALAGGHARAPRRTLPSRHHAVAPRRVGCPRYRATTPSLPCGAPVDPRLRGTPVCPMCGASPSCAACAPPRWRTSVGVTRTQLIAPARNAVAAFPHRCRRSHHFPPLLRWQRPRRLRREAPHGAHVCRVARAAG